MFPVCLWEIVRPLAIRECNVEDQIVETTETLPAGAATDDVLATTVAHPAGTSFPRLLQALRMERGWTKADLAKRARFDPSTITRLEQGSREPERDTVLQLADAMALTAADRDRLLAACGYRSETWDDPDLVQLATLLADPSLPATVRRDLRTMVRTAISHGRLARAGLLR